MDAKEFSVFRSLLADVHAKAFGEPISKLPHGKAQTLSWLVQEATGEVLSYKSLGNYVCAAIDNKAERVNPTVSTLAILAKFLGDSEPTVWRRPAICVADWATWFRYRSKVLAYEEAA